ncbi:MAG: hypothetical protein J2P30_09320 [Actinobacteria bacterium]|nr:hypothetical protein [Actinomycetota bacterium]
MPARNRNQTPAAPPAGGQPAKDKTIPVRLYVLVRIDPDKWNGAPKAADGAPEFDAAAIAKALEGAGYAPEQAATMAEGMRPKPAAHGPAAVRTEVREAMLAALKELPALKEAGATVVDADRAGK